MPITATFPTITFPHRGELVQDDFVTAQETGQDLLSGSFTTALNTFKDEANTLETNVNNRQEIASAASYSAEASALSAEGSANYQGLWVVSRVVNGVTLNGYTVGQTVSDASGIRWLCKLTHTTAQAAVEGTYWTIAIPYIGAIGNINSPLLDMPLKNSLAMKSGVGSATFTRASTATYIDRYGVLKAAAIDEPRFEKEGYLNEGASTNLLLQSEDFITTWNTYVGTTTPNTTATTDPYGTNLAEKYVASGAGGRIAQNSQAFALESYITVSVFAKKEGASNYLRFEVINAKGAWFNLSTGVISNITASTTATMTPLANGWYRCSISFLSTGITTALCAFYPTSTAGSSSIANDSMYIFGAQLEALPFATSYIPTVASTVTRSADIESTTKYNNFPSLAGDFTLAMDVKSLIDGASSQGRYLFILGSTTSNKISIHQHSTTGYLTIYYGADLVFYGVQSLLTKTRIALTKSGSSVKLNINGTLKASFTITIQIENDSTNFYIGSFDEAGGAFYGNITNFRIFDKALTAQEVAIA